TRILLGIIYIGGSKIQEERTLAALGSSAFVPKLDWQAVEMAAERESMTMRNLQLVAPGAGTRTFPGEVAALPSILHVDKPGFRRDCIGEQLAAHLPEWRIEAVSSVRDCPPDVSWASGSLVIISLPEASIGTAEFAADIAFIAHAVPGMPVMI